MFTQILKSLPKQTAWAKNHDNLEEEVEMPANVKSKFMAVANRAIELLEYVVMEIFAGQVNKLLTLGFCAKDCLTALEKCGGNLDNAALWLTQNALPQNQFSTFLDFASTSDSILESGSFMDENGEMMLFFQQLEVEKSAKEIFNLKSKHDFNFDCS